MGYSDNQVTVCGGPEEDSLPRQPIAHEDRDLFNPEVRRFRAVVRQMVEARPQRYGGTVGTHPRDARPELRDEVLALLQAMDSGQTRPHHADAAREMNLCPSPGVHSKSDRDDAEFVRGDRSDVASKVAFDGIVE